MKKILTLPIHSADELAIGKDQVTHALEQGQVLFFPQLPFSLQPTELALIDQVNTRANHVKNISYHPLTQKIKGCDNNPIQTQALQTLMQRYAEFAMQMIHDFTPHYAGSLKYGRTSFRPVEIKGRVTSKLQDDTKLHVDAFPATPVQGQRLLRVFANINPHQQPRRWLLGEPFSQVVQRYMPQAPRYSAIKAKAMQTFKLTKSLRTPYDHYMLHLHNSMKLDPHYQATVEKEVVDFPANSCWMVYTDHVSHAALSGQFLLEQTFYLPPEGMLDPTQAPAHILKKY